MAGLSDLIERAARLRGYDCLVTDGYPLYLDKARRFPGRTFILGADALARMLDPAWGVPPEQLLAEFESLGTRLRVAGRVVDGVWTTFDDLLRERIPARFFGLFDEPIGGRSDISSTELRAARPRE